MKRFLAFILFFCMGVAVSNGSVIKGFVGGNSTALTIIADTPVPTGTATRTPTVTPTGSATPTATTTTTPVIVAEQSRCMKQADNYTTTCSSVAPAASPVPTVLAVPSPGHYWKYELSSMNVGTATGRRTMTKGGTACTENMVPLCPRLWCENGALNGAVTLDWIYDAGVTFRDTLKAAQLKGGR